MEKDQARRRPKGVTVVGILTLLGAIGNFLFACLLVGLMALGGPTTSIDEPAPLWWPLIHILAPLLLSLLSFTASMGMFSGARYSWYLAMILWVSSATYYSFIALLLPFLREVVLGLAVPVNVALIIYFQSKPIKNYFLNSQTT